MSQLDFFFQTSRYLSVCLSVYLPNLCYFYLLSDKLFKGETLSEAAQRNTGLISYKRSSEPLVNEMKLF